MTFRNFEINPKTRATRPPIDHDLRATLSVLSAKNADPTSKGASLTELSELRPDTRELLIHLAGCIEQELVERVDRAYRLTNKGQGYTCPDNIPPGYSTAPPTGNRVKKAVVYREGRLPKNMGER